MELQLLNEPVTDRRPKRKNQLPQILIGCIFFFLILATLINRQQQPKDQTAAPAEPTSTPEPHVWIDERQTTRAAHLNEQEKERWKNQENTLLQYQFLYPPELAVRDDGILGSVIIPLSAIPKIDGKISKTTTTPSNFLYFQALPIPASNQAVQSVSPEYDQEWKYMFGALTATNSAQQKQLEPFFKARKEMDELLKLNVGEKTTLFERIPDTQFSSFTAKSFRSISSLKGHPAEVQELRYLYETPRLTYLFGGFVGGKTNTSDAEITPETVKKIFDTAIIQ